MIQNNYSYKIKEINSLSKTLSKIKKKIILCHGNFDVVHPGHVRHLIYAKSKADILVVSITADKYIKKGINRPYVSENLRALNLAAFEMVDYVVIDNNPTALNILEKLKPTYFAKGFEYTSNGLPGATKDEIKVLKKNKGKIIFTPGDIIYSSTKILSISKPNLDGLHISELLKRHNITYNYLESILKKIKKLKVHIVGDTIIDTYTLTSLIGGYTKTPTPSVTIQEKKNYLGGAAIVAKHLKKAGANVTFSTVVGNDEFKKFLVENMKKNKIRLNMIIDNDRPTTNKNSIIANNYNLLKIDKVANQPFNQNIQKKLEKLIKKEKCDIIIFSDFRHGVFNKYSIPQFVSSIQKKCLKVVDSQVATRWGNITDYKDFDLITPNEKELRFSLGDQDSNLSNLTRQVEKIITPKNYLIKLGEKGLVGKNLKSENGFSIPSFSKNVKDPVGAGDALLAYASLCLKKTNSIFIAGLIGSLAAACECEKNGNIAISPDEIIRKLQNLKKYTKHYN